MNGDPGVPSGAPSASASTFSPASSSSSSSSPSRRTRRASTLTRGDSTLLSSTTLPHHRRSSVQLRAQPENDADGHREGCLCVACHLSGTVFPRRQDGRIVLPVPWLIRSNLERGKFWSHVPDVEEATRRDEYSVRSRRRSEGQSVRVESNTDRGEGSSRGVLRPSGPGVAPSEVLPSVSSGYLNISDNAEPTRRRSNTTDRSRSYRYPKPYDRPPGTLHGAGHEESSFRPGINHSAIYLYPPSSLATPNAVRPPTQVGSSSQDPQGSARAGPSFVSAQFDNQTTNLSTPERPRLPSQGYGFASLPTSTRGSALASQPPPTLVPATWHPPRNESRPSSYLPPSRLQPSSLQGPQATNTPSNTSSQSLNSQSAENNARARTQNFPAPTSAPSSTSFIWRTDGLIPTGIRFQEPVVHDPTAPRESQVEIKWDTERKRRQGYFLQGEEGSNFRLYNQSNIS